jgi:hypothetical protein
VADYGTIEVAANAPSWLSLLIFARWRRMTIEIDGALSRFWWGTHAFSVEAGEHEVIVGMGWHRTSSASITIMVAAHETVRLRYTPRAIKGLPGVLEIEPLPSARVADR